MLSKQAIEQQLEFNKNLMEKLTPYADREVRQLSESLQLEVKKIKVGPTVTASGLEKVDDILTGLYLAIYNLEEASKDPEQFAKNYSETKPAQSTPQPKPTLITPPKTPIETPIKPAPKITINLSEPPAEKTKPSPAPPQKPSLPSQTPPPPGGKIEI